jgi:hypothetical protein
MKMIILAGMPNTGKSTTFNDVYDKITKGMEPLPAKIQLDSEIDFETFFSYKGKRVVIRSEGDTLYLIEEAIHRYAAQCDVLILAYSEKFKRDHKPALFDLARELAEDVQECVVRKTEASDADNAAACKSIIALIRA